MESMTAHPKSPKILHTPLQILLHTLGAQTSWSKWLVALSPLEHSRGMPQGDNVILEGQGFSMHMQLLDEPIQENNVPVDAWGLHSVVLQAADAGAMAWPHTWPLGLEAQDLSKATVTRTLGEPLVHTRSLSLFECEITHHPQSSPTRTIGVQCDWTQKQQLASLTLLRLAEFEPLSAFEFEPQADSPSGGDHVALDQPLVAAPVVSCRSGELTPKTGMYEGLLPTSHPLAASYNKSNMRFYFSQEGNPRIRMGMPDIEQDSMVVWIWRAASVQVMR
jgi:hypothetical protein